MNAGEAKKSDADQPDERSPFVDPDDWSLQLAQKLAEPSPEKQAPTPRLSIAHLFLWTTISAIVMAVGRSIFLQRQSEIEPLHFATLYTAYWYTMSILYGLQGAGLCVEAMRWRRYGRFSLAPGEWLLVVFGGLHFAWLTIYVVREVLLSQPMDFESYRLTHGLCVLLSFVVVTFAAVKIKPWSAWRWLFIASAVASAVELILVWGFQESLTSSLGIHVDYAIEGTLCLVAVVRDRAQWAERTWLHWTGVFTFVAILLLQIAWQLAWRFVLDR